MKSYEVKEIIERLMNAREIQEVEVKVGGKGRPTKRLVAVDPNFSRNNMKTPSLETRDDQKREERVAGFLEGLWGVTCYKLPVVYSLDYWIESKEKSYWCEVKCRSISADKYDTFIVSANKFRKGVSFANATGVPFIMVWAMKEAFGCMNGCLIINMMLE